MINIGLSSLIISERMISEIPETVQEFLNILIYSLSQEKINESKRLKKINREEIKGTFVKQDQNYSESESEDEQEISPLKENKSTENDNIIIKINRKDLEDFDNERDAETEINEDLLVI